MESLEDGIDIQQGINAFGANRDGVAVNIPHAFPIKDCHPGDSLGKDQRAFLVAGLLWQRGDHFVIARGYH
ncbi:MAG: hypothetical protein L3J02_01440 [Henriciella sp.]|nr:hypothetical protein [Henriciella sp.]